MDDRATPRPHLISKAHTAALREDGYRDTMHAFAAEHSDLIAEFIRAVELDDMVSVEIARKAQQLLERREYNRVKVAGVRVDAAAGP
jgi:hypothetical protein